MSPISQACVAEDSATSLREPSLSEFVGRFLNCEADSNFFERKVEGKAIWDYLRYPVFEVLVHQWFHEHQGVELGLDYSVTYPDSLGHRLAVLLKEVGGLARYLGRSLAYRPSDRADFLLMSYDRKNWIDGKRVNIQFHPLASLLSKSHSVVVVDSSRFQEEMHYPCPVVRSRLLDFRAHRRARQIRYSSRDHGVFTGFQKDLEKALSVPLDLNKVLPLLSYQLALGREYRALFHRFRPRTILYSDTGLCKGWIEEAHRLGIEVIDCPHALISRYNILYQYPDTLYPDSVKGERLTTLPDRILTFGEYWHRFFHLPVPLTAVGFPYFEMKRQELNGPALKRRDAILVISSMISAQGLSKVALGLARALPEFEILYKLRPDEYDGWRSRYPAAFQSQGNIRVIDQDTPRGEPPSLYELFQSSRYQLGINSTALVEGLASGLVTFVLKEGWHMEMEAFVQEGSVFLVQSADEIARMIREGKVPSKAVDPGELFRPGSRENIEALWPT